MVTTLAEKIATKKIKNAEKITFVYSKRLKKSEKNITWRSLLHHY